ncbi:MAG: NADH-quinone oxidoreductase subunit N [Vicinamibacterales bacterium]
MTDLALLAPEIVLVIAALALIIVARRVERALPAAIFVVLAAAASVVAGLAFSGQGEVATSGFAGSISMDGYTHFFKMLFAATLALAALLSVNHLDAERIRPAEFYSLLLLSSTGMMLAASATDLLIVYLGLELMTLCSYVMVGITRERSASNEAAIKYFLLASFASALFLYGISLTYGVTGATDYEGIAAAALQRGQTQDPLLLAAVVLVGIGLAFKIAVVPFHAWAPDAYQGASTPISAFLAASSKAAGLAALGRVGLIAFAPQQPVWSEILVWLAGLSMAGGSLLAFSQTNMKRMLAYSSIAHAGYALLGLVSVTPDGVTATMAYASAYAFMTLGAFGVVIGLGPRGEEIANFRGLATTAPGTAAVMLLFLLSLTGIPPTAGFAAKFGVILNVVSSGHMLLAVLAVLCSVVSAFFYLRVAVFMYMNEPQGAAPARLPAVVSAALAVAAFMTIVGGMFPEAFAAWTIPP